MKTRNKIILAMVIGVLTAILFAFSVNAEMITIGKLTVDSTKEITPETTKPSALSEDAVAVFDDGCWIRSAYLFKDTTNGIQVNTVDNVAYLKAATTYKASQIVKLEIPSGRTKMTASEFGQAKTNLEVVIYPTGCTNNFQYISFDSTNFPSLKELDLSAMTNLTTATKVYCSTIEKVMYPETITTMPKSALKNLSNLKEVNFTDLVNLSSFNDYGSFLVGCTSFKTLDLSQTKLTTLPASVFAGATGIEKIVLPTGLTSIEKNAFDGCTALQEINLQDTAVTSVGEKAFYNCSSLKGITFPATATTVSQYMFFNCQALEYVDMGASQITTIAGNMFIGGNSATTYLGAKWIRFSSSLTTFSGTILNYCPNLEALIMPSVPGTVSMTTWNTGNNSMPSTVKIYTNLDKTTFDARVSSGAALFKSWERVYSCDLNTETTGHYGIDTFTDSTCQTQANRNVVCACCGKLIEEKLVPTAEIPLKAHDDVAQDGKDATCTEDGYTAYTECSMCHTVTGKVTINALGHSMTFIALVPAQCEIDGTVEHYYCSRCKKDFDDNLGTNELTDLVITALVHSYTGETTITYANGLDHAGLKQIHCVNCVSTQDTDLDAIIVVEGYSTCEIEQNGQILAGYSINQTALAIYEGAGKSFTFGVLVGFGDNTVATNFASVLANNENEKVFGIEVDTSYSRVNITIEGITANDQDIPLVICAFAKQDEDVAYYQNDTGTLIGSFRSVTYTLLKQK